MAKIESIIKSEIARLAKHEVRSVFRPLKWASFAKVGSMRGGQSAPKGGPGRRKIDFTNVHLPPKLSMSLKDTKTKPES